MLEQVELDLGVVEIAEVTEFERQREIVGEEAGIF